MPVTSAPLISHMPFLQHVSVALQGAFFDLHAVVGVVVVITEINEISNKKLALLWGEAQLFLP